MNVSTILDYIDGGHMILSEFQRGYTWNRDQRRALMVQAAPNWFWDAESKDAEHQDSNELAPGVVKLHSYGRQRMTMLYDVIRDKDSEFCGGETSGCLPIAISSLESEDLSFKQVADCSITRMAGVASIDGKKQEV